MSTYSRLSRINQEQLFEVYTTGSVDYSLGDFNLFSINTKSNDANKVLVSIPLVSTLYSEENARKLFDFEFTEFVDDVAEQLESEIQAASSQNVDVDEYKHKIIELRVLSGQGDTSSDFSDEFPFEPLNPIEESTDPADAYSASVEAAKDDPRFQGNFSDNMIDWRDTV